MLNKIYNDAMSRIQNSPRKFFTSAQDFVQDAIQEAYLEFFCAPDKPITADIFSRRVKDIVRTFERRFDNSRTISDIELKNEIKALCDLLPSDTPLRDKKVKRLKELAGISRKIKSDRLKHVFVYRTMTQLKIEEIAERMDKSIPMVKVYLSQLEARLVTLKTDLTDVIYDYQIDQKTALYAETLKTKQHSVSFCIAKYNQKPSEVESVLVSDYKPQLSYCPPVFRVAESTECLRYKK